MVQRWQERFGEILSAPAEEREHDLNTSQHPIGINEKPSKHTEIVKAINQLKKKKAAFPRGIPPEILMACPNTTATLLEPLIKTTRELERFPVEWKNGYMIKL